MIFAEIRKWAKEQGFSVKKEKDDSINGASYYWFNIENPNISGISISVSKLAKDLFNNITNNFYIEYQITYQENLQNKHINRDTFWY